MPDNRDITERLEDPSYDGAIYMRQDAAKEIRALRLYVARLEDQLAKVEVRYEKLGDHSSKQALDIVTLGQEVGRLREMTEWQPIETAPKDGSKILAWFADGDYSIIYWGAYDGSWVQSLPGLGSDSGYSPDTFIHWMPLPEPLK